MSEANIEAVRSYIAAAAARDMAAWRAFHAGGSTSTYAGQPESLDEDQVEEQVAGFFAGFPNLTPAIREQTAEGDAVVTHLTWSGTHTGEFMEVPPSGNAVSIEILRTDHFDAEGKISSSHIEFDPQALMEQIGAGDAGE